MSHPAPPPPDPDSEQAAPGRGRRTVAALTAHPWWLTLGLVALALSILAVAWDWNWFKSPLERQVEARTGRAFAIGGELDVEPGWPSTVHAERVRLGNAPWSRRPTMATAERVELTLALWPLLTGELRIPQLHLVRPRLLLETAEDGGGNWQFGDDDDDDDGPLPVQRLWIDRGRLRFVDAAGETDIVIDVGSIAPRRGDSAPPVALDGGGRWRANPLAIEGRVESPLELRESDRGFRIDLRASSSDTRAHARGVLVNPLQLDEFDLQLALSGENLADLYPLIGIATPPTPPYALDGRLSREVTAGRDTWRYRRFAGQVDDSDLSGDARVVTGGERPYLHADLVSDRLDLDDLAGFVGGGQRDDAPPAADEQVIPDTPYRLDKLRAMDAEVRLRARRIVADPWPVDDMDAHLLLEDGLLRLDPLDFGISTGTIRSTVRMDARGDTIHTRADIAARGLDLSRLLPDVELAQNAIGKVSGNVALTGSGESIAQMLGSSHGEVAIGMGRGRISNLLMEMAGLDLAEIVRFTLTEDQLIPVRCAFGDFAVEDGVMSARALAFDTTDTILVGEGDISLREETFDLLIRPRPKDRSLLSLRSPLVIDGSFRDPDIRPDAGRLGLRGAIALALGTIAPPAALLATLELGPGEDAECGGEYAK